MPIIDSHNIPTWQVLIYDGTMDIISNHPSQVALLENMKTWEGRDLYRIANTEVCLNIMYGHLFLCDNVNLHLTLQPFMSNGKLAGEMKSVKNLRHLLIRNSGHMAPRDQPEVSLDMFDRFITGAMYNYQ